MLRRVLCVLAVVVASSCAFASGAAAQAPGSTVRLMLYDGALLTGAVVSRTDSLWTLIREAGDTVVVANRDVLRRELQKTRDVRAVRRRIRSRAATIGAFAGAGIAVGAMGGAGALLAIPVAAGGAIYFGFLAHVVTMGLNDTYWQEIQ